VSMLGVSGRELTLYEKAKQVALAGVVSLGLFAGAANAVDVKMARTPDSSSSSRMR